MEVQRLNKIVNDEYETAQQYYEILGVLNDLGLAKGEIQLIAFTAIKGNITLGNIRKEYCTKYDTTIATINNIVHRMKKKNIIHKVDGMLIVNPKINQIDFSQDLGLIISVTQKVLDQKEAKIVAKVNKKKPTEPVPNENKIATDELPNLLNDQKYG